MRTYEEIMEDETLDLETNGSAMYELGMCFLSGNGTEIDEEKGWHWIEKAADAGCEEALGMIHSDENEMEDDEEFIFYPGTSEIDLFDLAKKGDVIAGLHLYFRLENPDYDDEMFELFKTLSTIYIDNEVALMDVQRILGHMYISRAFYFYGNGDIERFPSRNYTPLDIQNWRSQIECGIEHYKNAIELGSEEAKLDMIDLYSEELAFLGDTLDQKLELMKELANSKYPRICYLLGYHYLFQNQVRTALLYMKQALLNPDAEAMENVYFYLCEQFLLDVGEKTLHSKEEIFEVLMNHLDDFHILQMVLNKCVNNPHEYGLERVMEVYGIYLNMVTDEMIASEIEQRLPRFIEALSEEEVILCANHCPLLSDAILRIGAQLGYESCIALSK